MKVDDMCKYLGSAVIILILIYICVKTLSFQASVIEGMSLGSVSDSTKSSFLPTYDTSSMSDTIKSNYTTFGDPLAIDKNRSTFEEAIVGLEIDASLALLLHIMNNAETISADPTSSSAQSAITVANNLVTWRSTLNEAMSILDQQ